MEDKEPIIDTLSDLFPDVLFIIIPIIIGIISNYISKSPNLKNLVEKSYKALSYIITFVIIACSLATIVAWIGFLNDKETIVTWIITIAIGIIIGFCWYLYIKSDKDYEFKDE